MKKILLAILKFGIPVAISAGLAYYLCTNVEFDAIKKSLSQDVTYWWFIPVIVVSIFSHIFRALRWRLQLRAIGVNAPVSALVNSIFGTYFVNLIFPRLGEVWRCGYIASRQKASVTKVMGSMVGDRLSDTVTVLLLTVITFFLAQDAFMTFLDNRAGDDGATGSVFSTWWFWALVGFVALIALGVWWLFKSDTQNKVLLKIKLMLKNFWEGFYAITKMKGKWLFLLYTILIWGCYFMQLYIASKAFTFTADLGIVAILVLFVLSSIGMAVPTNGGLGAWQYAIIFGLAIYGVGSLPLTTPYNAQASAFAWLVWGVQTLLLIVLGIYAFIAMAIDRRRIAKGKTIVDTTDEKMGL
ncbi:MAG: flippase-like domain-containing protein [Muribaculaceae bacterium]|nr:flippase-like domain-containing protein [Muribaculaceae bacterium]